MIFSGLARGALAGAAGTTALNAATYADMSWRARSASTMPQQAVTVLAERAGHPVPGQGEVRENRLAGLGSLSGIATGVGIGAVAGVLAPMLRRVPFLLAALAFGGGAMAATDLSMLKLGLTDPAQWSPTDWLSDAVPHLAYGVVSAAALRSLH
ncbi:MAG: hypothetical protein ABR571_15540 [Jatrophihabitans sp.]|uniref:hypothetical protein n=1 Tax=Jatrophihabitans sp. TaxID=1932789 RepID=UPI00390E14B6